MAAHRSRNHRPAKTNRFGIVVIAVVALFYLAAIILTFGPQARHSKGEFSETEYGEWQDTD